jgi:hypothetical protein
MTSQHKGSSFGLTSSIGFGTLGSTFGKGSLLNPLKTTTNIPESTEGDNNKNLADLENEEFNIRKKSQQGNMNEKFAQRIGNKGSMGKIVRDEIEEIPSINKLDNNFKVNQTNNVSNINDRSMQSTQVIQENNSQLIQNNERKVEKEDDNRKTEEGEPNKSKPLLSNTLFSKNQQQQQQVQVQKKSIIDEMDPKIKLYNLIMSKDEIDKINLRYFLYT